MVRPAGEKIKIKIVTFNKEDVDECWLDRTEIRFSNKRWHFSIDPYLNNHWKPWFMPMSGYNKYTKTNWYCLNIGWLVGAMFEFYIIDEEKENA